MLLNITKRFKKKTTQNIKKKKDENTENYVLNLNTRKKKIQNERYPSRLDPKNTKEENAKQNKPLLVPKYRKKKEQNKTN